MMTDDPGEGGEGGDVDVDLDVDSGGDDAEIDDADDDGDDVDDGDDDDLTDEEEAEYQAEMAKIRGEKKKDEPAKKDEAKPPKPKEVDKPDDNEDGKENKENTGERHTLKINGVEKQMTTQELIASAQKAESSEQRFQEGATLRKQAEGLVKQLHEDPTKVLDKLNVPAEKIEQWLYDKHIAPQILQGEEKEQWERNKEFERLKASESQREEQDKAARQEQSRKQFSDSIVGAIKAAPGVPQTDWSVNRVAQYMQRAIKGGFRDVTPQEVMPHVIKDWNQIKSTQMDSLDDDQMLEYIGEAGAEKVRRALVKKHEAGKRKPQRQSRSSSTSSRNEGRSRKKNPRSPYDLI